MIYFENRTLVESLGLTILLLLETLVLTNTSLWLQTQDAQGKQQFLQLKSSLNMNNVIYCVEQENGGTAWLQKWCKGGFRNTMVLLVKNWIFYTNIVVAEKDCRT